MRRCLALIAAVAGCDPKPLRVIHEGDAAAFDASLADAALRDGAFTIDGGTPVDGALIDASTRADVVAAPGPSCMDDPKRDDCARVRVAATGEFCLGVAETGANVTWNASPPLCGISLSPFEVDAREVSVGRFRAFYARWAAGALPPWQTARFANGLALRVPLPPRSAATEWNPAIAGCTWSEVAGGARELHPMNCVGWTLAMYFCAWEGGHLVTSAEYEYLARWLGASGGEGRAFPWGDAAPSCALAHYGACPGDDGLPTRRGGALGAGPAGVFDLAGNVAELVADDFAEHATLAQSSCWTRSLRDPLCQPSPGAARYARGGSHQNDSEALLRAVFRPRAGSGDASPARGLRCAYPPR